MRTFILILALALAPFSAFANEGVHNNTVGSLSSNNNNQNSNNNSSTTNISNGGVNSAGTVVNQASEQVIKNVVPINNTNLIGSGSDVCLGSITAGASAPGISISGGKTTVDENCVMMKRVSLLSAMGLTDTAVALLINSSDDMAMAFYYSFPEMVEQFAPHKYVEIQKKLNKLEKKAKNCSFNCN